MIKIAKYHMLVPPSETFVAPLYQVPYTRKELGTGNPGNITNSEQCLPKYLGR